MSNKASSNKQQFVAPKKTAEEDFSLLQDRVAMYEFAARRFEDLFHGLPVACYTYDETGNIHDWNETATKLWGYKGHEIVQKSIYDTIFSDEERESRKHIIDQVVQGNRLDNLEVKTTTASGETKWTLNCEMPQYSANGLIVGGLSANVDISDRKRAEAALSTSENLLRTAYDALQNGVMIIDEQCCVKVCNPSACEILGIDASDLVGHQLTSQVFEPMFENEKPMQAEDLPSFRASNKGEFCTDTVMGIKRPFDQEIIWINVKSSPIFQNDSDVPNGAVVSFSDITMRRAHLQMIEKQLLQISDLNVMLEVQHTELESANAKLENLAHNDGLTGVANHRAFQDSLESHLAEAKQNSKELSVLLLDVDHFKSFNDDFGHQTGDSVLIEVAQIISDSARSNDFTARYGGEEFVVVLPKTTAKEATKAAERIRENIEKFGWNQRNVTVSIGITTLNGRDVSNDKLIEEADKALYASKHAGRNRSTHYSTLSDGSHSAA